MHLSCMFARRGNQVIFKTVFQPQLFDNNIMMIKIMIMITIMVMIMNMIMIRMNDNE